MTPSKVNSPLLLRPWILLPLICLTVYGIFNLVLTATAATPLWTLQTKSFGSDNKNFKADVMLIFDGSLSSGVISEENKIAGSILKLYDQFDSRFKVAELLNANPNEEGQWNLKANREFSTSGLLEARKNNQFATDSEDILYAAEKLAESSRPDAEKSLVILASPDLYNSYKENNTLVRAMQSSKIRTSWITCTDETIGVSCKMLAPQSSQWSNVNFENLGPSVSQTDSEGANIETSVYLRRYPVRFDKPLPIRIEIIDKHLDNLIDSQGHLYFPGNSYTKKAFHKLTGKVNEKKYQVDIDLEVHSHVTYLQVPESISFELRDRNGVAVTTTSNAFSLRSDMVAKNIMDWSSDQLKLHSIAKYIPTYIINLLEKFYILPSADEELINVCFFGVIGSGKSTTQNTLLTSLRTDDFVETMRPAGGGSDHVTVRIEGVDLTQSIKRSNIRMRFWDSFGLSVDNWPDTKFREFLNGRLNSYSVDDDHTAKKDLENADQEFQAAKKVPTVPLKDRIHSVLLFMPAEIFKNEQLFQRMVQASKIAVSEGYNPLLMVTFINDLSPSEREVLKDLIVSNFNVPRHQVIFVPYYGEKETRNFETDFESLYILDRIRNSAESFLESHYPTDQSWVQSIGIRTSIVAMLVIFALGQFIRMIVSLCTDSSPSNKAINHSASQSTLSSDEEDEVHSDDDSEVKAVTIYHFQNTMQILVHKDTKLKDILSNVAKTFQVDESKTVFVDENGNQYPNEAAVLSCAKIYTRVMTTM